MTNFRIPAIVDMANKMPPTLPETSSTKRDLRDLGDQSVAGEEDPGASLSIPAESTDLPASQVVSTLSGAINPSDEASEGTLGTSKDICCECGGLGRMANGPCAFCSGSGKVNVGSSGA